MIIIEDKGQKLDKHIIKHNFWNMKNVEYVRYPLPVGDYVLMTDATQDVIDRKTKRKMEVKKMDFLGSYKVAVDTKKDIAELISDICGKQHDRFRDECILAQNNGIKLYILVENRSEYVDRKGTIYNNVVRSLEDLKSWKNPRLFIWKNGKQAYPSATRGITLAKSCYTMQEKYGVKFVFCTPEESGQYVIDLLGGGNEKSS